MDQKLKNLKMTKRFSQFDNIMKIAQNELNFELSNNEFNVINS